MYKCLKCNAHFLCALVKFNRSTEPVHWPALQLQAGGAPLHPSRGHQAATIFSASTAAGLVFCSCLHCQLLSVGNKVSIVREPGSACYWVLTSLRDSPAVVIGDIVWGVPPAGLSWPGSETIMFIRPEPEFVGPKHLMVNHWTRLRMKLFPFHCIIMQKSKEYLQKEPRDQKKNLK